MKIFVATPGTSSGGGGGPAADVAIADGADVTQGTVADAVVAAGAAGTVNQHLRRLSTDIGTLLGYNDGIETLLAGGFPAALGGGGGLKVEGNVAADAAVSANPLLLGGRASLVTPSAMSADGDAVMAWLTRNGGVVGAGINFSSAPTLADSESGNFQLDTKGNLRIVPTIRGSDAAYAAAADNADGTAASSTATKSSVISREYLFNGTGFDRYRNVVEASLLTSSSRSATPTVADQVNYNGRGVLLVLNVTVEAAAETLSLKIQGKDSISSNYYDIVDFGIVYTSASQAPTLTILAAMFPGALATDMVGTTTFAKSALLPRTWRPVVTHSSSGAWTYSLASVTFCQ